MKIWRGSASKAVESYDSEKVSLEKKHDDPFAAFKHRIH
jgi:hypothetical protein